jgi:rubrerythrin/DNA-directed RNA polymerase subunit M/transcription elongation factor TFIIS
MNEVERLSAYIKEHVNQPPLKRFVKEAIDIDPRLLIMAGHNPNNVKYVWYYDSASNKIIGSYKSKSHDDQEFADISSKSDVTRGRVFEYNGETYLIIYGAIAAARNPTPEEVRNIYLQVSDIYDGNIDYVIDEEGNDVSDLTESVINEVRCPRCKHQYTTQCRCRSFTSDDGKKTTYTCEKCGKKFEVEREKSFWDGTKVGESKANEAAFGTPFAGNNSDKKLQGDELLRAVRFAVAAEYEAVQLYMQIHDSTDDELTKKVMKEVAEEEIVHAGEFIHLLMTLSPEETDLYAQGTAEVEDKMGNKESKPSEEGEPVDKDKQLVTGVEAEPKSEEKEEDKEVPKESVLKRFVAPVIKEGVDYSAMNIQDATQHVRDLYLKMGIQDPTGYENRRTIQHEIDRANAAIKSRQGKADA